MPGCVIRVCGRKLDIDKFLQESCFKPCLTYRRGEYKNKSKKTKYNQSGMNIVVSNASGKNFKKQINDTRKFLEKYKEELAKLKCYHGVESVIIDFGINIMVGSEDSYFVFLQ